MKNPADLREARSLVDGLVVGTDVSIGAANALEVLLSELFEDDDDVDEMIVMLAMYRPGGGEFLYSIQDLRPELGFLAGRLDAEIETADAQAYFSGDE